MTHTAFGRTRVALDLAVTTIAALLLVSAAPAGPATGELAITGFVKTEAPGKGPRRAFARMPARQPSQVLSIRLASTTPEVEIGALRDLAAEHGELALYAVLASSERGTIATEQSTGRSIAIVQETADADGRRLLLVIERDVTLREFGRLRQTALYPYVVLDLHLDDNGRGRAELFTAARLRIQKDGALGYESLDRIPVQVLNVRAG